MQKRIKIDISICLILLVVLFFWKVTTLTGALFHFDLIGQNIPIRSFFFEEIAQGKFPLWSSQTCSGFPFFAEGQAGPLFPLNYLLYPLLPAWIATNLTVVLHALIGIFGMFYLLRLSHSAFASAIGAISYAFNAHLIFHLVHLMFFQAACLMPWAFFFFDRFLNRGRISDLFGCGLMLSFMITIGQQQLTLLVLIALCLYASVITVDLYLQGKKRQAVQIFLGMILAVVIILGISSVIWVKLLELVKHSIRERSLNSDFFFIESLTPDLFVRLASPFHHGRWMNNTWWLGINEKEMMFYLGLSVWLFAPLALVGRTHIKDRAHLAIVAFGVLFMLGKAGPFADLIPHVPILQQTRVPVRFLFPMMLSFSFLVSAGLEKIRSQNISARKGITVLLLGGAGWAGLAFGGAILTFGRDFLMDLPRHFSEKRFDALIPKLRFDLMMRGFLALSLIGSAVVLLKYRKNASTSQSPMFVTIGLLVFIDLASIGMSENPVTDPDVFGPFKTSEWIRSHLQAYRIYSTFEHYEYSRGGWCDGTVFFDRAIEGLPHETPLLFDIPSANCATPLILERYWRVVKSLTVNWLRHMAVKYVLSPKDIGLPIVLDTGKTKIFEVPAPATRFGFAKRVVPLSSPEDVFSAVASEINPSERVYVEGYPDDRPFQQASGIPFSGKIRLIDETNDRYVLETSTNQPTFLIIRQNAYPGWHADLDGHKAPIYRANYLFFGLDIPQGVHRIKLVYRPTQWIPLVGLSLTCLIGTLWGMFGVKRFRLDLWTKIEETDPNQAGASKKCYTIALIFLMLFLLAILRHPEYWRLSLMRFPYR